MLASETLLPKVAAGDRDAVRQCIDRYGGLVWSLAKRLLGEGPDAEEAVQDVFIDLWKNASRYDPDLGGEATFVAVIARRRLIDCRRRLGRFPEVLQLPDGLPGAPACRAEVNDEAAVAAKLLDELRPEQRHVIRLAVCEGMSHDQVARATGLPLGTVKTHVRRGLQKVRDLMTALRGGGGR